MSSPTQYFVWTRWEITQTQHGWIKLIEIWRTTTSRNWIASMTCRRSSSGKYCQDSRRWKSSKRFKNILKSIQCEPEHFYSRIIFMSMFNDIVGNAKGINELCVNNWKTIKRVCRKILSRSLVFPRVWIWNEVIRNLRLQNRWILRLNCRKVLLTLVEINHPKFREISVLERGEWRSKGAVG